MFTSKDLKKLIIPLIFEQLLAVSVGFVDTFMVSIAGEAAVSGVALVDNISNLLIQILSALPLAVLLYAVSILEVRI
nr:MATE family efflux transporter [Lachnospira eligens]